MLSNFLIVRKYLVFLVFMWLFWRPGCPFGGMSPKPKTFKQNAGAADECFLLLFLCIRTTCPPDFEIFIHEINVTDATVGHSKWFPYVLLSTHTQRESCCEMGQISEIRTMFCRETRYRVC